MLEDISNVYIHPTRLISTIYKDYLQITTENTENLVHWAKDLKRQLKKYMQMASKQINDVRLD